MNKEVAFKYELGTKVYYKNDSDLLEGIICDRSFHERYTSNYDAYAKISVESESKIMYQVFNQFIGVSEVDEGMFGELIFTDKIEFLLTLDFFT